MFQLIVAFGAASIYLAFAWGTFKARPTVRNFTACMSLTIVALTMCLGLVIIRLPLSAEWLFLRHWPIPMYLSLVIIAGLAIYFVANEGKRGLRD